MKLQPASQKQLCQVAIGTGICTGVMLLVFAVLAVLGVYPFSASILLGAVAGALVAILNFAALCLTVQAVAAEPNDKTARAKMQLSYNGRLLAQAVWCIVAFAAPCFQVVAAVLPLLFPRVAIVAQQKRTAKAQPQKSPEPAATPPAAEPASEQER